MIKKFELKDDNLHVTVQNEDAVYIPNCEDKENIGKYVQETVQIIEKDKIEVLHNFMKSEKEKADTQLKQLKEQYDPIKDLQEISEDILTNCVKAIKKGSKAFKESMEPLNKRINDLSRKNGLKSQIEFVEKQLKDIESDLESLNGLVN